MMFLPAKDQLLVGPGRHAQLNLFGDIQVLRAKNPAVDHGESSLPMRSFLFVTWCVRRKQRVDEQDFARRNGEHAHVAGGVRVINQQGIGKYCVGKRGMLAQIPLGRRERERFGKSVARD